MALPVAQLMAQIQEGVVAEAEEMMEEAGDLVATSATCSFSKSELADHAPCAENVNINVKIIGASQEMCSYLPPLQKLPAALVIRKVNVTNKVQESVLKRIHLKRIQAIEVGNITTMTGDFVCNMCSKHFKSHKTLTQHNRDVQSTLKEIFLAPCVTQHSERKSI